MSTHKRLTPKESLFITEFLTDFNGTQAVIRAGYSEKNAPQRAYELLTKPHISAEIEKRKQALMEKRRVKLEDWVSLVTRMAFGDPRKLFDTHGNCKEIPDLSRKDALMVAGFEIEETFEGRGEDRRKTGYVKKFKLADRAPYVAMLGKYLNAFPLSKAVQAPNQPERPRYDPRNLTPEEWAQAKVLLAKMQEGPKTIDHVG